MSSLYFFDSIKKSIVVFAKQFTNISVTRKAKDGSASKTFQVELILANKEKFYQRINRKDKKTQIVLPAMSIWNDTITYNIEKQKNPQHGFSSISKKTSSIHKYMRSPSPVTLDMTLRIRTVYYSDMMQIVETIVPRFQPKITKSVNLINGLDVSVDIPIILTSIEQNFDIEMDEDPESLRMLETDLTFQVETYMFPPIEEKHIASSILLYNGLQRIDVSSENTADDIVNSGSIASTDYSREKINSVVIEETVNSMVYRVDATQAIASATENFIMRDNALNELPFVFEYDNGELYGNDDLIPSYVTGIAKTGYVFVEGNHLINDDIPSTYEVSFWTNHNKNYSYGTSVLKLYNDFNIKTFSNLHVESVSEIDKFYMDSGTLYMRCYESGFSDMLKIYDRKVYKDFTNAEIGLYSFTYEEGKILCGISNRESSRDCFIRTTTGDSYEIVELYDDVETVLAVVSLPSGLESVLWTRDASLEKFYVSLNGNTAVELLHGYYIPWVGNDFDDNYIRYRYIKQY